MASVKSFNPSGSELHQPVMKRQIRDVKDRARGIVSVLPFKLPRNRILWLLTRVGFMSNAMSRATALAYAAPRELLIGRKLNFKWDNCVELCSGSCTQLGEELFVTQIPRECILGTCP